MPRKPLRRGVGSAVAVAAIAACAVLTATGADAGAVASVAASAPQVASTSPVLAVQGRNGQMYVSKGGGSFVSYGGTLRGTPATVTSGGRVFYFVRGSNDDLYVRTDTTGFTRPHPGLLCATSPGASTDGQGNYVLGCIGTNGLFYALSGTLPTATNQNPAVVPVERVTVPTSDGGSTAASFDTDSTAVKGGVGSVPDGLLLTAVGTPYSAGGSGSNAYGAGNTYVVDPTHPTDSGPFGITCSFALTILFTGDPSTGTAYGVCHAPTGSTTLVYRQAASATRAQIVSLGGQALGSPGAGVNAAGTGIVVDVTGTNDDLYTASLGTTGGSTGFTPLPAGGTSSAGPSLATVTSTTAQARPRVER